MKSRLFFCLALALFSATAGAQFVGWIMATVPVGGSAFRPDAQIEIQNTTGGHALLSISNVKQPCTNDEEAAISFNAYSELTQKLQMASISAMWANDCTIASGYGVLRFNVAGVNQSSDVEMRIFGKRQGIDIFGVSDSSPPGGRFIRISRTPGQPSITGRENGLVLNGNESGAQPVWINAYGSGTTVLSAGGGQVQIGTPVSNFCPSGWKECLRMLDSNGSTMYLQVGR